MDNVWCLSATTRPAGRASPARPKTPCASRWKKWQANDPINMVKQLLPMLLREGRIDFDVQILLQDRPTPEPTLVSTSVEAGEPFYLGRLDFRGHHSVYSRDDRR